MLGKVSYARKVCFRRAQDKQERERESIGLTDLAPNKRQTASMTVWTKTGGVVKTRISEMSFLSRASSAYDKKAHKLWDKVKRNVPKTRAQLLN